MIQGLFVNFIIFYTGSKEVFKIIFEEVEDKNPRDCLGMTPLHVAAQRGHLDICKIIMQEIIGNSNF